VRAGDRLGDEEAQSQAIAAAAVVLPRTEGFEDARQDFARDHALVAHLHRHVLVVSRERTRTAIRGAVLHRVGGQVGDGLHDAVLVPSPSAVRVAIEAELAAARDALELADDLAAHRSTSPGFGSI
jgi:hypothetical protein